MEDNNNLRKEEPEIKENLFSLDILNIIKTSQNQHGLRHGDYQRYRQYCSRRLRHLRKALHFTHGKIRFQKKVIEPKVVTDERFLLLILVKAERDWGYAMQLKDDAATQSRARFHMHRKLAKAVSWAKQLENICNIKADKRTILEAEAYCSWLSGTFLFEKEQWAEALVQFVKSRTVYSQLGKVGNLEFVELCKQKLEEIEPSVRYCNYNLNKERGEMQSEATLLSLNPDHKPGLDLLQSKLDSLIAETVKQQASSLQEFTWKGKKFPIKNEKLRLSILTAQQTDLELERVDGFDAKMAIYDKLFTQYSDTIKIIKEELQNSGKSKFPKSEAVEENLNTIRNYVTYLKLKRTVARNLLLVSSLEKKLISDSDTAEIDSAKRVPKPGDLVKLYDSVLQIASELQELVLDDPEESNENLARILSFKGFRCFYIALSYSYNLKWEEALALFDRSSEELKQAKNQLQSSRNVHLEEITKIEDYEAKILRYRCDAHARGFLDSLKGREKQVSEKPLIGNISSLLQEVNNFDTTFAKERQLIAFPPEFEAVKCKPFLFDLALSECDFPTLEARKTSKPGFWNFWSR